MKTYKNLWDKFISRENFDLAAKKAIKSKKNKRCTKKFLEHYDENIEKLRQSLMDGTFKTSEYRIFKVYEPKEREIYELPLYPDHILHHALINILGPIWKNMFISDSYACIPDKGLHAASKRIMTFVRRNKYVLQCDVKKFFPSINHDIMMNIIQQKISDRRLLRVLDNIVRSVGGGTNLPIGNLTSQWLANVYLNQLDMFVKHELHVHDYLRYCDDFCLFGNSKKLLRKMESEIVVFLENKLNLRLSKSCMRLVADGVNMIGYRHFRNFILLRKRSVRNIRKRLFNIARYDDYGEHSVGQIASSYGWLKHASSFHFRRSLCNKIRVFSEYAYFFILSGILPDRIQNICAICSI
ncbi:MAG: reverse transcriptase/maturase family protein [Alphaproteobacteria bacterium]|nr:reverse transcriptase/maturase family protein [Alphaproteobacteria bacterium]